MASTPIEIADSVIESFKERLEKDLRESIDEHHFHALHGMVREAVAEYAEAIVERVARDLSETRSDMVERRPLEL